MDTNTNATPTPSLAPGLRVVLTAKDGSTVTGTLGDLAGGWWAVTDDDGKAHKARAKTLVVEPTDEDKEAMRRMSNTLLRYRPNYVACTAYSGKASLNNGDTLADLLAGFSPEETAKLAEDALGLGRGFLLTPDLDGTGKYDGLNPGQIRMNSGNRLRAAVKKGNLTVDAIAGLV